MSPEKQRIAIAEILGATDIQGPSGLKSACWPEKMARFLTTCGMPFARSSKHPGILFAGLPPIDQNTMHEVEEWLSSQTDLIGEYCENLGRVVEGNCEWERIHATAAERAEAFLRTVGKWEET